MTTNNILFLGAGRMGGAILRGWVKTPEIASSILVIDPTPGVASKLKETLGIAAFENAGELPAGYSADAIVVAVKPQIIAQALSPVAEYLTKDAIILSIAAGISISQLQALTRPGQPVVRCMPNLAAEVGQSATVAVASGEVADAGKQLANTILTAAGAVHWLGDEAMLHAVTAISGSGPAYIFALAEAMASAAANLGLPDDLGHDLAIDTILGAAALLKVNRNPTDLRKQVTSPNGTTQAALEVLQGSPGLNDLIFETATAAAARSRQLAGE